MSLRNTLKATIARVTPLEMKHATFRDDHATGDATAVQQTPAIPHGIRAHAATVIATAMQQGHKTSATTAHQGEKLRVSFPSTRNTQQGSLTAHRLAKEVITAAMNRCDEFNDSDQARADMRLQVSELPPHLQADLLDHFNGKPVQFE